MRISVRFFWTHGAPTKGEGKPLIALVIVAAVVLAPLVALLTMDLGEIPVTTTPQRGIDAEKRTISDADLRSLAGEVRNRVDA